MKEIDTINKDTFHPNTISSLKNDLRNIGITNSMILIVHSSLSSIGWVCGGPVAVLYALEETIGNDGTLIMPTHSSDLSEPSEWRDPPVPEAWWQIIRVSMPAYDKDLTPTRGMGTISETFRKQPGVKRSAHPCNSFAAWGKYKEIFTDFNKLDFSMDMNSPLGKVYEYDGYVLLLGVGHDKNTSLHLAEYITDYKTKLNVACFSPVMIEKERKWIKYIDINLNGDDFISIGNAFEAQGKCKIGRIGAARSVLFRQRDLVDFASDWMKQNR